MAKKDSRFYIKKAKILRKKIYIGVEIKMEDLNTIKNYEYGYIL